MSLRTTTRTAALWLAAGLLPAAIATAQLTDETQTTPNVPGGAIGRSLAEQIGAGHGDEFTYGSAVYLIRRDPARSIRRGRQLFQRKFTLEQGVGPRVSPHSEGDIMTTPALGAGLADSCAACHGRPRGAAGFGGDVATRPDSRDAPHLFGLGVVEMLADEMTADLRRIRDEALAAAARGDRNAWWELPKYCRKRRHSWRWQCDPPGGGLTRDLVSKGVSFGRLTVRADGSLDLSEVEGVDEDLRVRPFFHHGGTVSMREFIIGALKAEMGLEAPDALLCAATDPVAPLRVMSPAGMVFDPALDTFERPPVCDALADGDGDGVVNEVDMALVDHMEFYLLNYFKPGRGRPSPHEARALATMEQIGCLDCHVQNLAIERDRRVADVETVHDPQRGMFNRLFATAVPMFDVVADSEPHPLLVPQGRPFVVRNFFSDLKRHDLGPAFHERQYDGTVITEFVTEPLWGVATTAPYGHDGRSINLEEVILRHGGEAGGARDAFAGLGDFQRRQILDFLDTLVLFPPDDTASNLNPGDPNGDPQDPAGHGSINLGALFQIGAEGPE